MPASKFPDVCAVLAHDFFRFFHLANAALRAISDRCSGVIFFILAIALALPPLRPSLTAAGSFRFAMIQIVAMLKRLRNTDAVRYNALAVEQ